jgi:outer membrane biosynthesis protein TonB
VVTADFAFCVYHGSNVRAKLLHYASFRKEARGWVRLHMKLSRQLVALPLLALLVWVGCQKKAPQLPTQAKAPAEVIPSPLPVEITEETPPPPVTAETKPQAPPPEEAKPKASTHRKRKPTQPTVPAQSAATAPPAAAGTGTTTIAAAHPPANPAAAPPNTAIAAEVSSAQLSQQKQTTAQLLDETEKTVSGLNRTLSKDDEEIVVQIRSYVTQSRSATKDGDFERAYNLANKAHLLSAALIKK